MPLTEEHKETLRRSKEASALKKGRVPNGPFLAWYKREKEIAFKERGFVRVYERTGHSIGGANWNQSTKSDGQFDKTRWRFWLGITEKELETIERMTRGRGDRKYIDLTLVDRILCCVGEPGLLNEWYPVDT